ncbi:8-oxo-dGTP diphosphatase [Listeria monocytogenes]|uniref:8-oxo-dGTP diphosphatase n=1 Tax=Listeria monocytogenes TaxID=1639 RepID=A0A6V9TN60_LISMN|nr:8-oxo-dGTP diphosphatase [Listeria monocytogenes]EAC7884816.1 8-oxo-dGTP diphosphatase [Listeria monocytogenes]EAD7602557.1 8-oxo-dGTP diphosphatase [Listeria monocytogenes]EAE5920638.1 8-oxo-dGTP diphosphatase [Listeria monocytogenes]EAE6662950.1 8-oxo-dGTP diphosphatase [Listeria monocytogenes]EAF5830953.1 8-oxo-dGTP diphosphatase [Listeria monocytogenes]
MYKYTLCFIQRADEILLLNRQKSPWMGSWNGVGGKIEQGEALLESIKREITEETGISSKDYEIRDIGEMKWFVDGENLGGMYLFLATLPDNYTYPTPRATDEGILDFKKRAWILNPENTGVVNNLPYIIQHAPKAPLRIEVSTNYQENTLLHISHQSL